MKKLLSFVLIICMLLFVLAGCKKDEGKNTSNNTTSSTTKSNTTNNAKNNTSKEEKKVTVDYEQSAKKQMAMPEAGETIAIIHTRKFNT